MSQGADRPREGEGADVTEPVWWSPDGSGASGDHGREPRPPAAEQPPAEPAPAAEPPATEQPAAPQPPAGQPPAAQPPAAGPAYAETAPVPHYGHPEPTVPLPAGVPMDATTAASQPAPGAPHDPWAPAASDAPPPAWMTPTDTLGRSPRRGLPWPLLLVTALVVALVAGLAGGAAGAWWEQRGGSVLDSNASLPAPAPSSTLRPAGSVAGIATKVLPSVVAIQVTGADGQGTGSGFVLRQDGYLLTNNHVVAGAANGGTIDVVFQDGSEAKARVVGRDASYDLAVIKVDRTGLPPLELGDSDSVVVGDSVIAIGAPLGLQGTVTTGIVSAKNRPVSAGGGEDQAAFINAIQTDAAINPGNSGGPLVDLQGRVVGVNSAIARVPGSGSLGTQSGNIGLGFAIPSNQARKTAEQLIRSGKASHPVIGVVLDRTYTGEGVRISPTPVQGTPAVTPGGPADKAGLKPGDVILRFEGRPLADPDELVVAIRAKSPGDKVTLLVRSGGKERQVTLQLQASDQG